MAELRLKQTGTIQLFENDNTSKITIASPASLTTDRTITLPDANVTLASGTMLATDGSGASLTALNATEITSGTIVDDARLPTVGVDKGGTNLTSFSTGDIVYASGATTISKLAKPGTPDGEVLTFAACASAPSWAAAASGISWQSVQTSTPFTAVAGNGYPVNTTSGAITMNLPAGVVGEQVAVVDYAGTFDTNALTISADGSENIKGSTTDQLMTTERQAGVLTYVDATQGWVLTSAAPDPGIAVSSFMTATGGTITTSGDYKIHTFNADGNFIVTNGGTACGSNSVDYLIIAGGGGTADMGGQGEGGGGAGGVRQNFPNPGTGGTPISATTYPIVVGGGGTAGTPGAGVNGGSGDNSVALSVTGAGGGGGGQGGGPGDSSVGTAGGSGGGGGGRGCRAGGAGNTPPAPVSQGNPGGSTKPESSPTQDIGGGGGGWGGSGGNASNWPNPGGQGGIGAASSISGSPVTYASGGGGGSEGPANPWPNPSTPGGGGRGGGLGGACSTSGSANTGGGGGGGDGTTGGSGKVIIRYKFQ